MNKIDVSNRVAVITGGARGIGYAAAERLIAGGAKAALWDIDGAEAAAARLKGAIGCRVDVTDESSIAAALAETERRLGPVEILVASAGITGPNTTVAQYPAEAWRKVIEIDLTGVFLCCRAVVPGMQRRNYGRIVNIASIAGKEGNPNAAAYAAAKGGVIAMTKAVGKECAKYDIAINTITPATAKTRILDELKPEFIDYMLSRIPRGRFLEVEEIANMVSWLVSKENSFTTASVFDLSGGRATY